MNKIVFPKKILVISLFVISTGLVVSFFLFRKGTDNSAGEFSQDSLEQTKRLEETLLPVKVVQARRSDLIIKLKSPGEAVTNRKIIIRAEVEGVIKRWNVEESKHVKKGDLLVELDNRKYKLELERYEADRLRYLSELLLEKQFTELEESLSPHEKKRIQITKENYEKARRLYSKGIISEKELKNIYRQYEMALIESGEKKEEIMAASKGLTQAEINIKKAIMELEKTKIKAPFSGIICDIQVFLQEYVTSGRELFTLVNINQIQVYAKVLESEIAKMKVGRQVDLRFSAYPGKVFKGKVKAISPIINPEDKTCRVIIDVANPEEEIKPGMHTEVEIAAEIHKDRLLIPQESILVRGGRKLVFVVENGLAKWRYIEVGLENEDYAEVLKSEKQGEGVKEGEYVIVEGHFTLAHDARVKVIE